MTAVECFNFGFGDECACKGLRERSELRLPLRGGKAFFRLVYQELWPVWRDLWPTRIHDHPRFMDFLFRLYPALLCRSGFRLPAAGYYFAGTHLYVKKDFMRGSEAGDLATYPVKRRGGQNGDCCELDRPRSLFAKGWLAMLNS